MIRQLITINFRTLDNLLCNFILLTNGTTPHDKWKTVMQLGEVKKNKKKQRTKIQKSIDTYYIIEKFIFFSNFPKAAASKYDNKKIVAILMKFSLCVARRNDGKIQPFYVYIVAFAFGVHVLLYFSIF